MNVKKWDRYPMEGIYQFVAEMSDGELYGTAVDISDELPSCREAWKRIKDRRRYIINGWRDVAAVADKFDNYRDFCRAYRIAREEWCAYCDRMQRRIK